MPPVRPQARARAQQQHYPTARVSRNFRQPQSSLSEPSDTSIITSRRQQSDNTAQHSRYDRVRDEDRRRWAAGEHPGPDWNNEQSMKAWLEQRFPQGTKAGSPYYQFMIASSRFEDTYWLPGRGSKEVVGKFSEKEWKRWSKEKAGLVMHSKWGQNPLYPDTNEVEDQEACGYSCTSSPNSRPLTQEHHSHTANVDLLHKAENTGIPCYLEVHLDTKPHDPEKGHSSRKRTADCAELGPGKPSVAKGIKVSPNSASSFPNVHSIPEKASNPKKRTASNAEIDTDESPCAKRVKEFPGPTSPLQTANLKPSSPNSQGDRTTRNFKHAPRSILPPPEDREAQELERNPHRSLRSLKSHEDQVPEHISRSNPRVFIGQEEDALILDADTPEDENDTETSEAKNPNACRFENSTNAPHANNPRNPQQQTIQIILPAPNKTPTPPSKQHKERRKPLRKHRRTSDSPVHQTQYTTMHLRSGIGKRRHKLPSFVHLGMRGRKEVQIAGCFLC